MARNTKQEISDTKIQILVVRHKSFASWLVSLLMCLLFYFVSKSLTNTGSSVALSQVVVTVIMENKDDEDDH